MTGTCAFRIIWICTVFRAAPSLPLLYHAFPLSWAATILLVNGGFLLFHRIEKRRQNTASQNGTCERSQI